MKLTKTDKGTYLISTQIEIAEETKELLKNNRTLYKYFSDDFLNEEKEIEESISHKLEALIKFIIINKLYSNEKIIKYLDDYIENEKLENKLDKELDNYKMITKEVLEQKKDESIKALYQILRVQYDTYLILKQSLLNSNSITPEDADKSLELSKNLAYNSLSSLYENNPIILEKINEAVKNLNK